MHVVRNRIPLTRTEPKYFPHKVYLLLHAIRRCIVYPFNDGATVLYSVVHFRRCSTVLGYFQQCWDIFRSAWNFRQQPHRASCTSTLKYFFLNLFWIISTYVVKNFLLFKHSNITREYFVRTHERKKIINYDFVNFLQHCIFTAFFQYFYHFWHHITISIRDFEHIWLLLFPETWG